MTPIKQVAKEFSRWLDKRRASLNPEQLRQAEYVRLSFRTIDLNRNNPDARAAALRHHARDVEILAAIL